MAFIDFNQPAMAGFSTTRATRATADVAPTFTALEVRVLALSRRDGASSLRPAGRLTAFLSAIFGLTRPNRLADPKLEALRRMAVTARLRGERALARETARFLANGYTMLQATTAIATARMA